MTERHPLVVRATDVHGARGDTDEVCETAVVCSKPHYAFPGLVHDG
ncbi:hypothetical protein ABS735_30700 [Streptomyces sp. MMCC 100]